MDIITRDNKDYLKTVIFKVNSNYIECTKFFEDLENARKEILLSQGKDENDTIGYDNYGGNIEAILKRFSGTYFSPSFMKSFMTNPANLIFGCASKEEPNDATAIGTTLHKVLEIYYNQDKKDRKREDILRIAEENKVEGQDEKMLKKYFDGYIDTKDYLDESVELDDTNLDCFCEVRGKSKIFIPKFNYEISLPVSYVVDRIDLRDNALYIIDYKTGYQTSKAATFDGYLGSMLLYKWAVEQEYGLDVKGGYLATPGNQEKYIPLNFSLVNESKMISQIEQFCNKLKNSLESKIFDFTDKGYFTSKELKEFREKMRDPSFDEKELYAEVYIGEHKD